MRARLQGHDFKAEWPEFYIGRETCGVLSYRRATQLQFRYRVRPDTPDTLSMFTPDRALGSSEVPGRVRCAPRGLREARLRGP